MSDPINGDELLARINPTFKEVRTQVCFRPDLLDKHAELTEKLDKAQLEAAQAAGRRLGQTDDAVPTTGEAVEVAEAIQAVEAEIDETSVWFTHRAMPTEKFEALKSEHPPRKDNQWDQMRGYNGDAVNNELVRRCLVDPVFSDKGWDNMKAACPPSEWAALVEGAVDANGRSSAAPKSELASRILSKRGSGSE